MHSTDKIVLIAHCIDAEGPLYESFLAKFERLDDLFGHLDIEPTKINFQKLQNGEICLGGLEDIIAKMFSPHLMDYNDTWDKLDKMLERLLSTEYRYRLPDSYGNGWFYNFHCMDHVGFEYNPRRRDMGYHNIFDHYQAILKEYDEKAGAIHWHFHPMSTYRDAHLCASSYINSPELYQILCRRIIERKWFPTVNRAGCNTERPDSHWFLEQWIPFDISNMSMDDYSELETTIDTKHGRAGDWRLATSDWSIYRPSHDNYQLPGDCRRWIARVLAVLSRRCAIDQKEMDKAFERAQSGKPTLVGITGHDYNDIVREVEYIQGLLVSAIQKYPDVKFKYCEVIDGFQNAIWPEGIKDDPLDFEVIFHPKSKDDVPYIEVITRKGKVFGPQPFLSIQTRSRRFIHDNFDFSKSLDRWYYAFQANTLPLEDVAKIGVAANDKYGNSCIKIIEF